MLLYFHLQLWVVDSPVRLRTEREPETRLLTAVVYPSAVGPGTTYREPRLSRVGQTKPGTPPVLLALVRAENEGVKGM